MENKHWREFYKENKAPERNSNFSEAVESFFVNDKHCRNLNIFDLGAGNGRDTEWLNECYPFTAKGFDKNNTALCVEKKSLNNVIKEFDCPDVVYSRFFLHSISNENIIKMIKWTKYWFVAEFRIIGDKPKLYTDHKRNLIDLGWLVNKLVKEGFDIESLQAGKGLAKYKNEDPLVARVYARRFKK